MTEPKSYRVYVVEDDLELSAVIERILRSIDAKADLDWATSAEEAIAHLKELADASGRKPYDLIVADVFLDGATTGLDLWRLCQQAYPDIPLLVTSGISPLKLLTLVGAQTIGPPFLPKPFSIAECSRLMGAMLIGA